MNNAELHNLFGASDIIGIVNSGGWGYCGTW